MPHAVAAGALESMPATTTSAPKEEVSSNTRKALSPSQITTWLGCQAAHFFGSTVGLKEAATETLALNRALRDTFTAALRVPLAGRDSLKEEAAAFMQRRLRAELATVTERTEETNMLTATALLQLDAALPVLRTLEAAETSKTLKGSLAGVPLTCVVDCVTAAGELVQFAPLAKKSAEVPAPKRRQLAIAAALASSTSAKLITITANKAPQAITQPVKELAQEVAHVKLLLPVIQEQMASGLIAPNRGSLLCSRHNCGFWHDCEKEFGGKVPE